MSSQENKAIVRRFMEAYNNREFEIFEELVAENEDVQKVLYAWQRNCTTSHHVGAARIDDIPSHEESSSQLRTYL